MKTLLMVAVSMLAAFSCNAEKLKLSYSVSATILDDDGKAVGKRVLKPGTIVEVVESDSATKDATKNTTTSSKTTGLKASGMSPMEFLNEKPANSVTFMCNVSLREDLPYELRDKYKGRAWGFYIDAYGKTSDSSKTLLAIATKDSRAGKKLYAYTKDGETHGAMLKVHGVKTIESWSDGVIIDDFSPLPDQAHNILNKQNK